MATTPTGTPGRRHVRHDSNGGFPPLRPQPSSPTLTNPDMILPDYDDSDPTHGRLQYLSLDWGTMPQDADQMFDFSEVVDSSAAYPLNTPIIYGNGTMLSDIGEVTEVESNVGGPTRRLSGRSNPSRRSNYSDDNLAARMSPPTMGMKQFARRAPGSAARDSLASIDSAHTIPAHHDNTFADFDDTISVDDSNFQGDDEESVASFFIDDRTMPRDGLEPKSSNRSLNEDRYSTSSISRRAEEILANAKRRLTTMEGNLTRARTFSYSSVSDGSTPSPIRTPAHARNVSENSLSTTPKQNGMPQRSASALGAAGGYRQPLPLSRSADAIGRATYGISQHPLDMTLEPLSEDDGTQDLDENSDSTQVARYASPTFNGYNEAGIVRSASAAQMRGIQDQMNGLKGKIFSLREQAAADSMKRRSLQSLRAPSLFTHAVVESGDSEAKSTSTPTPEEGSPALGSPFRPEFSTDDINPPPAEEDVPQTPAQPKADRDFAVARHSPMQNLHQAYLQDENTPPKGKAAAAKEKFEKIEEGEYVDEEDDVRTENGDAADAVETEETADKEPDAYDSVSESGDSLYHETLQHPISHEDREDAFDYEHFFLHSAMGHLSRQGYNDSDEDSGSECSEASVETTRAAPTTASGRPRRPSIDTLTSVDSFATALEGRTSRISDVDTADDGYESPVIGVVQAQPVGSDKRPTFASQESGSSSEDSRSSQEKYGRQRSFSYRPTTMASAALEHTRRLGLHRPSVSSFESTGTNRSFPLIGKGRPSANTTPRDSPDSMMRNVRSPIESRRSSLNEQVLTKMSNGSMNGSASGSGNESVNGSGRGPLTDAANGSVHGLMNGSATGGGSMNGGSPAQGSFYSAQPSSPTRQPLNGEDQASIDRLLASIHKCAAGLRDTTPSGLKMHDAYRRRLEAARQILEGDPDSF